MVRPIARLGLHYTGFAAMLQIVGRKGGRLPGRSLVTRIPDILDKILRKRVAVNIIKKYTKYRKVSRDLNHKIMDKFLDSESLMKSATLLGINYGDTLVFDREEEVNALMDFALNEYTVNNKNAIAVYKEKEQKQSRIEKEILHALLTSYTSLFKIIITSPAEGALLLKDILHRDRITKLTDISFSKTAIPGLLLFTRLLQFKEFNMTSGVSFLFTSDLENYIMSKYKKLRRKVKSENDSVKRYVAFFNMHRTNGLEVRYE